MDIIGPVRDKTTVMVDDIIDTAGTITKGAEALREWGAREVYVLCTHPVFSGSAVENLATSSIKEIVVTNTIPIPAEKMLDKVKIVSVAPLLGEVIIRIHEDLSVSKLFD
jgi:ribose-phosphate pyrophosphokinase